MAPPRERNQPLKGRGALSNPTGRFERQQREAVDDGWYQEEVPDFIPTSIEPDRARSVITRNDSPDIPFEQSINPYRGCSHSCPYCYARPSHSYVGLSSGLDFETKLFYKKDAGKLLEEELAKPGYVCKPITLGANTDPYQPIERRMRVTRDLMEVLARCRHPVTIITKSALVLRDLDLLTDLAKDGLAGVGVSITTLDAELKRVMEPQAASPHARLEAVRRLSEAGVPTGVMVAPVIPALTDHEMEGILEAAAAAGARWAGYVLLRLPYEVKDLFREWLAAHYPDRAEHVMSLVQQMRGGKDYDSSFGTRMRGTGPLAELLHCRFQVACRRQGLNTARHQPPNTSLFRAPRAAHSNPQLMLDL
ncbi:MAG TPA: PA0069 family radical SAM protein [Steroidobacteraceae bacterium]|jgi:DNA repair photolyase|nr:PA0069 family radical SAM protein [Steroidobacteraceae bacterium]